MNEVTYILIPAYIHKRPGIISNICVWYMYVCAKRNGTTIYFYIHLMYDVKT